MNKQNKSHKSISTLPSDVNKGLPKIPGSGLQILSRFPKWIQQLIDDSSDNSETSDHEDEDTDEEEYANEHLEAESMLNEEGHDAKDWYLNQLNDKHESTARANLEPKDIKNLIKELMQPQ